MPDWVEINKKGTELLDKIIREDEVVLFKDTCSCQTEEDFNDGILVLTNRNIIFVKRDLIEPKYEVGLHSPIGNICYIDYEGIFYQMIVIEVNADNYQKIFKFMDFSTFVEGERKISEIKKEIQKIIEDFTTQK
ncbi:MAG: hypothetical protein ACUVXA_03200 [Candidatus Jordarchaeum sp.]|uniref:hypothetical protein n=1 Tax=Candidatus Jordarchaeum sp. TaxID=2823881 RepID=UPI00404AC2E8